MQAITVFCGSSSGRKPIYATQATSLGKTLAQSGITLVYGGAQVGLMGAVADGALAEGGKVIGVIPGFLGRKEIAHDGLTELIVVESMHERKQRMNELSSGVIALPGGFGTLEELFEMLTWGQLGLHQKPIGILNVDGYYDDLIKLLQSMVDNGLLRESNYAMVLVDESIDGLLQKMKDYEPPQEKKWMTASQT
ncbi:TIGR00730 family Rossman fold protein [Lewinella cohaerens]|uniref:LOG family protein n=1 Tax=Lewinella cohaerens TaxID=70995 RepID=UPI000369651D|nr:TIGR00730 family Rossman fold protein [Lewinella cohaerens]